MKITEIRHLSIPMTGNIANALVNFSSHTVSLVAIFTDRIRNGRPLAGIAFNSIGRFAQGGIIKERITPRLLAEKNPESLLSEDGTEFDCAAVLSAAMRNEKPGGHGDRASAAAAVELAVWDLNAKLRDEPAYMTIAGKFGRAPSLGGLPVYAAGGYYYPQDGLQRLADELRGYADSGYTAFKIKVGGAPLAEDMARVETALAVAEKGSRLAVDANGRFTLQNALAYARALQPLALRWFEEIGDPLDYALNRRVAEEYPGPIATGENLFSCSDVRNLLLYGGMRPGKDIFQMDPGLSYGLTEYAGMLACLEAHGFDRACAYPHGGHLINLHIAAGLNLGGCEAYPGVFEPFGGYSRSCRILDGAIFPGDEPGFGLEAKDSLRPWLDTIYNG